MPEFLSAAVSDQGRRRKNEDAYLICHGNVKGRQVLLAGVFDGMGGLSDGEVASSLVRAKAEAFFKDGLLGAIKRGKAKKEGSDRLLKEGLMTVIRQANEELGRYGKKEKIRCGTTATMVVLYDKGYCVAHVGDTRAYRYQRSRKDFVRLTKDQTLVQRMVEDGEISEEEAESHVKSHILLQAVGCCKTVAPEVFCGTYREGDVFLLCSDGLRHRNTDEDMASAIRSLGTISENSLEEAGKSLVKRALAKGETDNITCLLIAAAERGGT